MDFYTEQDVKVQKKIEWTLGLLRDLERVPEKYFKHISGTEGLYEVRIQVGTNIFRIFSFFDSGKIVILINGFKKKTMRTPKKEIELASKIMKEYFNEKK
ncbi:MAG: type II toxin-antitoxin system RelE/ParE family toxin [bacterium]